MSTARPRSRAIATAAAGSLLAASITAAIAWPSPASSTDAPDPEAVALAQAIVANPDEVTYASLTEPSQGGTTLVSTTPIAGFPTSGASRFAVLSTGLATGLTADSPDAENRGDGTGVGGALPFDQTTLTFTVAAPDTCTVRLDYQFLSDEAKDYVGFQFADAFTVAVDGGPTTTVSVNDADLTRPATGTTTAGETPVEHLSQPITPQPTHEVAFSIYDAGDAYLDSDVLLDDLAFEPCPPPATPTPTTPATPKPFTAATPRISGTPLVGRLLTARPGTWRPAPTRLGYQWLRNGRAIPGATHVTYLLTAADRGRRLTVRVTGTRPTYASATRVSARSALVRPGVFKAAKPRIRGKHTAGSRLTALPGRWQPAGAYHYQWLRDGKAIKGATHKAYLLRRRDRGMRIKVEVTATRSGYRLASRTSAPVRIRRR